MKLRAIISRYWKIIALIAALFLFFRIGSCVYGFLEVKANEAAKAQYQKDLESRQLILQAAQEGINGNGVATISPDNSFLLIVNLPPPQTYLGQGQMGMYATYLVDDKGKTGFLAGVLRPVGNGVYRAHFQSQVPLHHYTRVVVSVENPAHLGQAPNGPIVLKVKEPMGMMTFLNPMKTTATTIWGKISGLVSGRKKLIAPESPPISPELLQSLNQMGVAPGTMEPPIPQPSPPMDPSMGPPTGPS